MRASNFIVVALACMLAGCATKTVRQQDLDAWAGVPVEALDTHTLFIGLPMVKTMSTGGLEIRNYANATDGQNCFTTGAGAGGQLVSGTAFTTCSSNRVVCNNIFYIRGGKVIEYAPTGSCYTDETVLPQSRYRALLKN